MFKLTYKFISIGVIALFLVACDAHKHGDNSGESQSNVREKVYYTCSMHPKIKQDKPGKCPICQMNLTKVVVDSSEGGGEQVEEEIDKKVMYRCKDFPEVQSEAPGVCPMDGSEMIKVASTNEAGKVVAKVKLRKSQIEHFESATFQVTSMKMTKKLRVLGQVKSAEEKKSDISARFPGRVEKVFVESEGSQIKKGDPVVQVYSPELLTAGEELLVSARQSNKGQEFKELFRKAREKLILWGIRPSQIRGWIKAGRVPRNVTIYSNVSGVVRKKIAISGKYFKEGQNYFELSDLSSVWVEMDVYEHDSNLVKYGQKVNLSFVAVPGKPQSGIVDFISPVIDEKTRTLKVRTTVLNSEGDLKPGMVAQGIIDVTLDGQPMVVPSSAVIDTGLRKVVWLKTGKSQYLAKEIQTGFRSEGYVEVLKGLSESDKVVLDGNFMLDAQAQLMGGYEEFNDQSAQGHNH